MTHVRTNLATELDYHRNTLYFLSTDADYLKISVFIDRHWGNWAALRSGLASALLILRGGGSQASLSKILAHAQKIS
jgi:hypothetical protein